MATQKRSVDPRRNSRKQQHSQHDAIEKKYQLVDEESEVDTREEQSNEDVAMVSVDAENEVEATDDESDGIPSDVDELDEWTHLDLRLLHKDLRCPICLGILKHTKTFSHCLHRFCGGCINKAMDAKKECPTCRRSYGTNRVLRNDPNMDSIIEVVIGDISKYDTEILPSKESGFGVEQIHQQQPVTVTEDINNMGDTSAGTSAKRLSNAQENAHARKRTRSTNHSYEIGRDPIIQNEHQQAQVDENEISRNEDDENKGDDDIMAEIMKLRSKRLKIFSQDSSTDTDLDGERNTSGGAAAARNHPSSSVARRIKNTHLTRLAKHLRLHGQKKKKDDQFEIHVMLVSLDRELGDPEKPHLFCSPALSFHLLLDYVARETPFKGKDIQLLVVEEANVDLNQASTSRNHDTSQYGEVGHSIFDLLRPEDSLTLAHCSTKNGNLIIAYGQKNIS